ncbi:ATP synthase subunit I [uncultured Anaeromusa sp.]|uniref:N-ATPase subunit AtpR n=1 Tax=uncultured Anaeromusa sp. TaxID=673273 RepID=UPI0037481905
MEPFAIAFAGGLAAGGIFFGGLWWTVRRVVFVKYPVRVLLGSFILRTVVFLGLGVYLCGDDIFRIGIFAAGALLVRTILLRRFGGSKR